MPQRYLKKLKVKLVRGTYRNPVKGQVRDPAQVYDVFKAVKDEAQETLIGVYLTEEFEVCAYDVLSVGGENATLYVPREIFGHGFVLRAYTFILIHNHPSGKAEPSPEDRSIITDLRAQAALLNFRFLDFIVVGDPGYWSMFEKDAEGEYGLGVL